MENEKIFVIVPVYLVESYLERCINSILDQTYQNFELVLVDDGSPDKCPDICDRYDAEYENITVIHQENGGVSVARNTGIEYAMKHGNPERDWINFVDSDDFVHSCYLEYLYRAAKETGTDVSSCRFTKTAETRIVPAEVENLKYERITPEEFWHRYGPNAAMPVAKLYRMRLYQNIVYPVGKVHEDAFTTYKVLFVCNEMADIGIRLYYYYTNPNSITASSWVPARMDVLDALNEQLIFFKGNGYPKAYRSIVEFLYWSSIRQFMLIRGLSPEYDSHIPEMRNWQKYAFSLYSNEFGCTKAISYWIKVRFIDPAKRVLGKESVFSFLKRKIKKKLHLR